MSASPKRRRRDAPTPHQLGSFLRRLASTGSVSDAARAIGVSRNTLYRLRRSDVEFAARWWTAQRQALDAALSEATHRAVVGAERPVFHRGRRVGAIHTHDNKLLMSLLRLHWRNSYGIKAV